MLFRDLVKHIRIKPGAKFVMQHAYGGYITNLSLQVMIEENVMLAHAFNGGPLAKKHDGPARVFTPRRYGWKGGSGFKCWNSSPTTNPDFGKRTATA